MNNTDTAYYLNKLQDTMNRADKSMFQERNITVEVGVFLNSVALKLRKSSWTYKSVKGNADIFFSIWINDESIRGSRFFYNIHAFKLRNLKGYNIQSREFASSFRSKFKAFEDEWPNVSTDFGPLTLMQGWQKLNMENFDADVMRLIGMFLSQCYIMDELLAERKKN